MPIGLNITQWKYLKNIFVRSFAYVIQACKFVNFRLQ